MGRAELRAAWRAGRLAFVGRRIYQPLHQRDLQSFETRCFAAGGGTERGRRKGGRRPDARQRGASGPAIHGRVHALLRRLPVGRERLRRRRRRAGLVLPHRQSGAGRPDGLGASRRFVARLLVPRRTQPFGDWPHAGGTGRRLGANPRKASLKSDRLSGCRLGGFEFGDRINLPPRMFYARPKNMEKAMTARDYAFRLARIFCAILALGVLAQTPTPAASAANWRIDPARTQIAFAIDAVGSPRTEGHFRRV